MNSNGLNTDRFHRTPFQWYPHLSIGRRRPQRGWDLPHERDRTLTVGVSGWRRGLPFAEGGFAARRGQANEGGMSRLHTHVRCAINTVIAQRKASEIAPDIPSPETRP